MPIGSFFKKGEDIENRPHYANQICVFTEGLNEGIVFYDQTPVDGSLNLPKGQCYTYTFALVERDSKLHKKDGHTEVIKFGDGNTSQVKTKVVSKEEFLKLAYQFITPKHPEDPKYSSCTIVDFNESYESFSKRVTDVYLNNSGVIKREKTLLDFIEDNFIVEIESIVTNQKFSFNNKSNMSSSSSDVFGDDFYSSIGYDFELSGNKGK